MASTSGTCDISCTAHSRHIRSRTGQPPVTSLVKSRRLTGRLHGMIVGPTGRSDPGYVQLSVGPVGQTGWTDCSRTAHICQSNQCGLLADYKIPPTLQRDWSSDWPVGPASRSDQSDVVFTRFDSRIGSRTNMFDSSDRLSDRSDEAFTRYDRRTDQSVRLVCPTGRSDDRIM